MPDISSAQPDRLLRFVATADELGARLIPEAENLGRALDQVHRTCTDYCWPFPRVDRDVVALSADTDQLLRRFLDAALRFLAADAGAPWPGSGDRTAALLRRLGERADAPDPPPALATLILLAGDPSLSTTDLRELGEALLGFGGSVKWTIDTFGQIVTAPISLLTSPPARRLAEELARTPAATRILTALSRWSSTPTAVTAQRGLNAVTVLEDLNRLKRDGNPVDAWHRKGAGYIADVAGAGWDVSSSACATAPSYVTCGAAALTGAVWVGAEAWQHREAIGRAVDLTSRQVIAEARRIRDLAGQAVESVGAAQQSLIDTIRNSDRNPGVIRFPRVVTHAIADTLEDTGQIAGRAASGTRRFVSQGLDWITP